MRTLLNLYLIILFWVQRTSFTDFSSQMMIFSQNLLHSLGQGSQLKLVSSNLCLNLLRKFSFPWVKIIVMNFWCSKGREWPIWSPSYFQLNTIGKHTIKSMMESTFVFKIFVKYLDVVSPHITIMLLHSNENLTWCAKSIDGRICCTFFLLI